MRRSTLLAAACSLSLAATLVAAPSQAAGGSHRSPDTVAENLAGPLTLAVHDKTGKVYVTQSFAGQLSRVNKDGSTTTLVQDTNGDAGELVGVSHGSKGTYFIQTNYAAQPHPTSYVKRIDSKGRVKTVSKDLWAYEIAKNPDRGRTYGFTHLSRSCAAELAAWEASNPGIPPFSRYKGIVESHGYQTTVHKGSVYVADAAANAILKVDERTGKIRTVAVIPATPIKITASNKAAIEAGLGLPALPDCVIGQKYTPEPVPTDVKVGKDGKLYVTTLQGAVGEVLPLSKVYRVDAKSGKAKAVSSGMHGATGLDLIGKDIIVAEMFSGEVSIIKNGKGKARTLFNLPMAADVDAKGSTIYASGNVFGPGNIVKYKYRR
jgi:hypothetical protein